MTEQKSFKPSRELNVNVFICVLQTDQYVHVGLLDQLKRFYLKTN